MRARMGVDKVVLQFGSMNVAGNMSSAIVADPIVDSTVDISVIMTPHADVSITPHKQSSDVFLVTTSDTADTTAQYLIASTS